MTMWPFSKRRLEAAPRPKTYASSASKRVFDIFNRRHRSVDRLNKLETLYRQGGPVAEAVDCYPLFALTNGGHYESENEAALARVQEFHDSIDTETVFWQLILDAVLTGDGIAEIVSTADGSGIVDVIPRPSKMFEIETDEYGQIVAYKQYSDGLIRTPLAVLEPKDVLHVQFWRLPSSVYGVSLLERAADTIERYQAVAQGIAKAIERHGMPRYHIKVGQTGEAVSKDTIDSISQEFETLKPDNEMTTTRDIDIVNIDTLGVANVREYSEWTIQNLAAALGAPEEILGLGRGSTEATANVRLKAWYDKIGTVQRRVERPWNLKVVDRLAGTPGIVWWKFDDVSPLDQNVKADYVAKLMQANPLDPYAIVTPEWARKYLDIEVTDKEGLPGVNGT